MLAFVELLGWVADIIGLDLKTMSPLRRVIAVVLWGLFGLLFLCGGLVPLLGGETDSVTVFGGLLVSVVGAGFLARITYGLVQVHRLNGERKNAV